MAKYMPAGTRRFSALIAGCVLSALGLAKVVAGQPVEVAQPLVAGQAIEPAANSPSLPTLAADSSDSRLQAVERELRTLIDARAQQAAAAADKPTFQMGGQLQIDYLLIGQNAANRASVGPADDVFDFRRARLTARGEAFDIVEYAIGFDFALAGRPSFLDNFVAIRELPLLGNFRVGHYFEPFSLERLTLNRYNTFMERSLADTFAPARNLGMMAHNTLGESESGTWAVGWFRSASNDFSESFGAGSGWAITSRATWLPYYDEAADGRSFWHVGGAYTFRSAEQDRVAFAAFPEARAGAPSARGIPPFVNTGAISAASDQRLGAEFALVYGPFYVQSEYMCSSVAQLGGPPLFFQGAYGYVSYFLTGENRTYNKQAGTIDRVYPYENFFRVRTGEGTATGSGAWEVAFRWSFIDLSDRNIQGGNLHDITLGLNWYLNPFTRVRWEYLYAQLDRPPVGRSFAQIGGMRFDIDF